MYVYFDNNGVLKEIITERPFRVGDSQRDKIYIYWDGEHTPTAGWVKYRKADGTFTTETSIILTQVNKTLPTDPLQNLKYFSYEHTYTDGGVVKVGYPFYQLTVPSEVLTSAVSGDLIPTNNNMCAANVRFVFSDSSIDNLGVIVFSVETSIGILTDNSISETQYNYLIAKISQKFGLDNLKSVKVDELPEIGETGTIYYVKIEDEEIYDVYLWDALTTAFIFLGTTSCGLYTQEEGGAFESEVNEKLDDMTETIEGLGNLEPSGTSTSTQILGFTYDRGIWIGTDTGHWYYWNGTQYADGGIYQAFADGSISIAKLTNGLKNNLFCLAIDTTCNITLNFSNNTFTLSSGNIYFYRGYIPTSNLSSLSVDISSVVSGTFKVFVRNNTLMAESFFNAPQDGDIILGIYWGNNRILYQVGLIRKDIDTLIKKYNKLALSLHNCSITNENGSFTINGNGFIFYQNGFISTSNIAVKTIDYSTITGTKTIYIRNNTLYIGNIDSINYEMNDVILCIMWIGSGGSIVTKVYEVGETEKRLNTLENVVSGVKPLSAKIFMRVGCIGDSYTSGHIQLNSTSPQYPSNPNYAWPKYMKQLTGNEWSNFGVSGASTKSLLNNDSGQRDMITSNGNKCQAYVIGLMINDIYNTSNRVPLGTISDIGTETESYYSYYYKVIKLCLSVNSTAKIFCNTCPKTSTEYTQYNQAVRDIVNYCRTTELLTNNVFLVDLASNAYYNTKYFTNPIFNSDSAMGHYTALGYEFMAECMLQIISDVINNNVDYFKDTFLITYDE